MPWRSCSLNSAKASQTRPGWADDRNAGRGMLAIGREATRGCAMTRVSKSFLSVPGMCKHSKLFSNAMRLEFVE